MKNSLKGSKIGVAMEVGVKVTTDNKLEDLLKEEAVRTSQILVQTKCRGITASLLPCQGMEKGNQRLIKSRGH